MRCGTVWRVKAAEPAGVCGGGGGAVSCSCLRPFAWQTPRAGLLALSRGASHHQGTGHGSLYSLFLSSPSLLVFRSSPLFLVHPPYDAMTMPLGRGATS